MASSCSVAERPSPPGPTSANLLAGARCTGGKGHCLTAPLAPPCTGWVEFDQQPVLAYADLEKTGAEALLDAIDDAIDTLEADPVHPASSR